MCREVLIEAIFEYCEGDEEALQVVLTEAKVKNDHRQQIANQKWAKSMMERFGGRERHISDVMRYSIPTEK